MICALLVFQTPDLPAPLFRLSPWIDMTTRSRRDVFADLAAQSHRRFVKTHTPLDGLPTDPSVTYVCVGRDPRDVAISMHHHRTTSTWNRCSKREPGPPRRMGSSSIHHPRPARAPTTPPSRFWHVGRRGRRSDGGRSSLRGTLHHLETLPDRATGPRHRAAPLQRSAPRPRGRDATPRRTGSTSTSPSDRGRRWWRPRRCRRCVGGRGDGPGLRAEPMARPRRLLPQRHQRAVAVDPRRRWAASATPSAPAPWPARSSSTGCTARRCHDGDGGAAARGERGRQDDPSDGGAATCGRGARLRGCGHLHPERQPRPRTSDSATSVEKDWRRRSRSSAA